jgi:hypothetical protein
MNSFYKQITLLTIVVVLVIVLLQTFHLTEVHEHVWGILIYQVLLTIISVWLILRGAKGDNYDFYNYFMGAVSIRLLVSAFLLLAYFHFFKDRQWLFAFTFFSIYFLYTSFEIKTLLHNLQSQKDKK